MLAALAVGAWRLLDAPDEPAASSAREVGRLGPYPRALFYIERDRFLPATDPRTVAASEATWLLPEDEVFGVTVKGRARAYPITMISYHHVVNDVIQGIPIAVTY